MKVGHIGIVCRSEAAAARFFGDLLGLRKASTKLLPAALARQLFGIDAEVPIANYVGDGIHFEVLFHDHRPASSGPIAHVCLEIAEPDAFLERARAMNVTILRAAKGEGWVTFIEDDDGHWFEIKQAQA